MGRLRAITIAIPFVLTAAGCPAPSDDADFPVDYSRFEGLEAGRHTLFGLPPSDDDAPIGEECCMPTCAYLEDGEIKTWTAPQYTEEDLVALREDWKLMTDSPVFESNDFVLPPDDVDISAGVCAVLPHPELRDEEGPMPYDLVTYDSDAEAEKAGAMVTHSGRCGACSSLSNLAVYIAYPNLTEPVRGCGFTGLVDRDLSRLICLASLGFDLPCAQAWDFNTQNTQKECLRECGKPSARRQPANLPYECDPEGFVPSDVNLVNACLVCDEEESLRIFRSAAGRSRRGSGLPSPICRTCDNVKRLVHRYPLPEP